ncbi:MAG: response regulator transcription factor [Actinomycetota bacterium]
MRILVIDDEERLAASIARGLGAEGFDVDVVHDGADGLWRAREGRYAAIVLDIMLPSMNGYEVCRTLRQEGNWTPIIMLTAKDGEYDEAEGLELGADDYLRKPFSHLVLTARLRALARRNSSAPTMVYEVGDLRLDPASRRCRRGDAAIDLTPREHAVLESLMRRHPDVVPKQDLIDDVWGLDFAGDPNIVEVYVGYLRRKVDKPFDVKTVKTVRGVGYQVTAP